jgi:UDP:flavonoid glycosyltransferase YjiC (YdhE family)
VREVLREPTYRAAAQDIAAELAAAPGPDGAADLLENLAGAGRHTGAAAVDGGVT